MATSATSLSSAAIAAAPAAKPAPVIRFRNYKPSDVTVAAAPVEVTPLPIAPSVALAEREAAETARLVAEHAARVGGGGGGAAAAAGKTGVDDLVITIAPKKVNWDLKRDVTRKLDLLEKATQRAMADLVREEAAAARAASAGTVVTAAASSSGGGGSGSDELPAGMDAAVFARAVAAAGERQGRSGGGVGAIGRRPGDARWADEEDDDDGGGAGDVAARATSGMLRGFDESEAAAAVTRRRGGAAAGAEDIDIDDF